LGPTAGYLLSKYTQTFPISKELKRFRWDLKEKREFSRELNDLGVKCVIPNRFGKSGNRGPAFCIVHWNAPDFLLLNVKQLEMIYPNSKIYILDNGSQKVCLEELVNTLPRFKNVTLFSARPKAKSDRRARDDQTLGLQVLLNYSARQQDEFSVFLDQDCILCHNVDDLLLKFRSQKDLLIIGARDYILIPKQHNWLLPGHFLRSASKLVHPSLMIVQPQKIVELFGQIAFSPHHRAWEEARVNKWAYEPYHSLSYRGQGHILYLETKMHSEIPYLTGYSYKDVIYAYHAWYSSRTTLLPITDSLDGVPVSLLLDIRKKAYEYMALIHKSGTGDLSE
jgi:hypothetical protein